MWQGVLIDKETNVQDSEVSVLLMITQIESQIFKNLTVKRKAIIN